MLTGGYKIINLKNVEHTPNVGMVHEGIYENLENTKKVILVSGLNIDGKEYKDFYAYIDVVGSNFVITFLDYTITIADTDVVTVSVN